MSRASDTRWLYRVEDKTLRYNRFATVERSIKYLRRFMKRIWKKEGGTRRMPELWTGRGTRSGKKEQWQSFCEGFTYIELSRHQRNILVLIHELVHALGPCVHGPKFVKLHFRLLWKYAGYSRHFLQGIAMGRGITI